MYIRMYVFITVYSIRSYIRSYVTMYVCTFVCMQQNYGTAQQQLDIRTCLNGKKRAGKLNEYMPNPHGCPS